jgi:hypothetical protein
MHIVAIEGQFLWFIGVPSLTIELASLPFWQNTLPFRHTVLWYSIVVLAPHRQIPGQNCTRKMTQP